jgi:hypothetical protein
MASQMKCSPVQAYWITSGRSRCTTTGLPMPIVGSRRIAS